MAFFSRWLKLGSLAGALLMVLALACGGYNDYVPSGALTVTNNGTSTMTSLFVTPSSRSTWGVDQLAPAALAPGRSLTLTGMDPGLYDIQAIYADTSIDRVFDVQVVDQGNTLVSSMNSGTGTVVVSNASPLAITAVYLTPSSMNTWGPDQSGGAGIAPGSALSLTGISPDTYDLRVYFSDGSHQDANPSLTVQAGSSTTVQFQ
jgi:hypothetical protein